MHELTLAAEITELAVAEAEKQHAVAVLEITLEIGVLSGVDADALDFALSLAVKNTTMEHAVVKIIQTGGIGRCKPCNLSFEMTEIWTPCPECRMPAGQILNGQALRIVSLVVDDG